MDRYYVYKDSQGIISIVETEAFTTAKEADEFLQELTDLPLVSYWGCDAETPNEALDRFLLQGIEL